MFVLGKAADSSENGNFKAKDALMDRTSRDLLIR